MDLGAAIRQARKARHLTQAELGLLAYTEQPNVCAYERNYIKTPNPDLLRRFGEALGVELTPETIYEKFMKAFKQEYEARKKKRNHVLWTAGMEECYSVVEDAAARVLQGRYFK